MTESGAPIAGAWWVIHEADLMHMLERVDAGEKPDLVFAEHYANCEHLHNSDDE